MLGANPFALNLSEASHRIGNGSTGGLGAVHKRTGLVLLGCLAKAFLLTPRNMDVSWSLRDPEAGRFGGDQSVS
jgi:hypothetical protein